MTRMITLAAMLLASLFASAALFAQTPVNVALGRPVTALSPIVELGYGPPESVNDGTTATLWYTYQGGSYNTNSFSIDLGALYAISSIEMYVSQVQGFIIYSSVNGTDWIPRSDVNLGVLAFYGAVSPVAGGYTARYIRYDGYANWNQYVGMNEFQVLAVPTEAPASVTDIPVMSQWMYLVLGAMLLATGWKCFRRP